MRLRYGSTISRGSSTLSVALRHGSRLEFWNAMPTDLSGPRTGWPSTVSLPDSRGSIPEHTFITELLSPPQGPSTPTKPPRAHDPLPSPASRNPPAPRPYPNLT